MLTELFVVEIMRGCAHGRRWRIPCRLEERWRGSVGWCLSGTSFRAPSFRSGVGKESSYRDELVNTGAEIPAARSLIASRTTAALAEKAGAAH